MCKSHTGHSLLTKELPPEVERAVREFFGEWTDQLEPVREDLIEAVESGTIDPSSIDSIRLEMDRITGNYTEDFQVVLRDGTERGLETGREVANRRFQLDVAFDRIPQSTLEEFSNWADEAVGQTLETITEDTTRFVRSAHEEGLSIDDIAQSINDDLFDGRLEDWQAERTARTATIPSSNAGTHSALEDADSVVGEEWLATNDDRTRDSHVAAGGQIVAVGQTFLVGGNEARYPGDPSLPLEELIQCRCAPVPVFRDQLSDSEFARLEAGERLNV